MSRSNPLPIPELDAPGIFATGCNCGGHFGLKMARKELRCLALTVRAIDPLAALAGEDDDADDEDDADADQDQGEKPAGNWFHLELALALLLQHQYDTAAAKLTEDKLGPLLTGAGEAFDLDGFHLALVELDRDIRANLASDMEPKVQAEITKIISAGENSVQAGLLAGSNSVPQAIANLTSSTMHYADEFFIAHVIPAIEREITETLAEGPLARPNLQPILDSLRERLSDDPYWNLVANATASRSFHYGFLKAGQAQGYQTYVFDAVIDAKTTFICESLNGTTYSLAAAVNKYEAAVAAQTTDELKNAAPWYAGKADQDDVDSFVQASGVPIPPLHGYCRSSVILQ